MSYAISASSRLMMLVDYYVLLWPPPNPHQKPIFKNYKDDDYCCCYYWYLSLFGHCGGSKVKHFADSWQFSYTDTLELLGSSVLFLDIKTQRLELIRNE